MRYGTQPLRGHFTPAFLAQAENAGVDTLQGEIEAREFVDRCLFDGLENFVICHDDRGVRRVIRQRIQLSSEVLSHLPQAIAQFGTARLQPATRGPDFVVADVLHASSLLGA
jgi:hypothetical protein